MRYQQVFRNTGMRFLGADDMPGSDDSVEEIPKQGAELGSTPKEVLASEESKRLLPEEVNDIISGVDEGFEAPKAPLTIKACSYTVYTIKGPDRVEKNISVDNETLKVETSDWEIENREDVEVRVSPEIEVDRAVYDGDGKLVLQPGDTLPEGAITEFVDGKYAWEQLLSWKATIYAATIAGKRVPKDEEYDQTLENGNNLDLELLNTTPTTGFRGINGNFYTQGDYTFLWSSTENDTKAWRRSLNYTFLWSSTENNTSNVWRRSFNDTYTAVYRYDTNKGNGYAVRLIQDV